MPRRTPGVFLCFIPTCNHCHWLYKVLRIYCKALEVRRWWLHSSIGFFCSMWWRRKDGLRSDGLRGEKNGSRHVPSLPGLHAVLLACWWISGHEACNSTSPIEQLWASLMAQGLRMHLAMQWRSSVPVQGTKIPQAMEQPRLSQNYRVCVLQRKILHATMKDPVCCN